MKLRKHSVVEAPLNSEFSKEHKIRVKNDVRSMLEKSNTFLFISDCENGVSAVTAIAGINDAVMLLIALEDVKKGIMERIANMEKGGSKTDGKNIS